MHRILCIEDGFDTQLIVEKTLRHQIVMFAASLAEARELLRGESFSLVLFDVELPDGNGLEAYATLADELNTIPVIFVTMKNDFATKATAFALGAEDFILKPFDPRELRLRVDAKLRKAHEARRVAAAFTLGQLIFNTEEQRIHTKHGRRIIDLTTLEFRIFHLIAQTPNKIFARAELLDRVWGTNCVVNDRAVDVHVSNLRRKIAGTGVTIEAVVNSGYRVIVDQVPSV